MSIYSLSHAQKRICYTELLDPGTAQNNLGGVAIYDNSNNLAVLQQAVLHFFNTVSIVRTRYCRVGQVHQQYLADTTLSTLMVEDFSRFHDAGATALQWAKKQMQQPLDFEHGPLFDCRLLKISSTQIGYFVKLHHFIADGWSFMLLTQQIAGAYQQLSQGQTITLPVLGDYQSVVVAEARYVSSRRFLRDKDYWLEKYSTLPDRSVYPSSRDAEGMRWENDLSAEETALFKTCAERYGVSENDLLVTLSVLLLFVEYSLSDITLGVPVHNRTGRSERAMVGMFTSTAPCRFMCEDSQSVSSFIHGISRQLKQDLRHQKYPFDQLASDLMLLNQGNNKLFHLSVNYYNTRTQERAGDTVIYNYELYNGYQAHDLHFILRPKSNASELQFVIDYRVDCYSHSTVEQLLQRFKRLLLLVGKQPETPLAAIKQQVLMHAGCQRPPGTFNASPYPRDKTVVQLFAQQAAMRPHKIALTGAGGTLTYAELAYHVLDLSRRLSLQGVRPGNVVIILAEPSTDYVVGLLAIMHCGAVYCPMSCEIPDKRAEFVAEKSNATHCLNFTQRELALPCPFIDLTGYRTDFAPEVSAIASHALYNICVKPEDAAYILFTSGSTGQPKGVVVHHQGLVNYCYWAGNTYFTADDTVPLYSSVAFDLTITSIFPPLLAGATIISYASDDSERHVLFRIFRENRCTAIKLTPAHLNLIRHEAVEHSRIHTFIVGGETLSTKLAAAVHTSYAGRAQILNEYGPTETVVGCMFHRYKPEETYTEVPIGVAAANTAIYLLNTQRQPVADGERGEIYIAGDGVAQGYINDITQTQNAFFDDPFVPGRRMYKSGDGGRIIDGVVHFLGRLDDQVKLNGYRIECAEIEHALLKRETVSAAKVLVRTTQGGARQICAYLATTAKMDTAEYQQQLSQYLPEYMIPSRYFELDSLPLTVNGKVDVAALPMPTDQEEVIIPRAEELDDPIAQLLLQSAAFVLERPAVAIDDSFITLGGDSIKAIQLSTHLADRGSFISVKDIIRNATFRRMLPAIRQQNTLSEAPQGALQGAFTAGPMIGWFMEQRHANPDHYSQYLVLKTSPIYRQQLLQSLQRLSQHHDGLRVNLDRPGGQFFYNPVLENATLSFTEFFMAATETTAINAQLQEIAAKLARTIRLDSGYLLRVGWVTTVSGDSFLVLVVHHLVVDGISWQILLAQLAGDLSAPRNEPLPELPPKSLPYSEWAKHLLTEQRFEAHAAHWRSVLEQAPVVRFKAPPEHYRQCWQVTERFELDQVLTHDLVARCNERYGSQTQELLLAALSATLWQWLSLRQIVIDVETHGRQGYEEALARSVGWFTGMAPVVLRLNYGEWSQRIRAVRSVLQEQPDAGTGFGVLRYLKQTLTDNYGKRIRFNYLGEMGDRLNHDALSLVSFGLTQSDDNCLTSPLEINAIINKQRLMIELITSTKLILPEELKFVATTFHDSIVELIRSGTAQSGRSMQPVSSVRVDLDEDDLLEILGATSKLSH